MKYNIPGPEEKDADSGTPQGVRRRGDALESLTDMRDTSRGQICSLAKLLAEVGERPLCTCEKKPRYDAH